MDATDLTPLLARTPATSRPSRRLQAGACTTDAAPAVHAANPVLSAEEVHARGVEEGKAQARQEFERELATLRREAAAQAERVAGREVALRTAIDAVEALGAEYAGAFDASLARLTALAAGRLLVTLAREGQLANHIARSVSESWAGAPTLALVLNESDHRTLDASLATTLSITTDAGLKPGEFRIITPQQRLDVALAREYQALCEQLSHDPTDAR